MSDTNTRIQSEIDETPVVLFMKGTPVFPQCGFSSAVVQVLTQYGRSVQRRERSGRRRYP